MSNVKTITIDLDKKCKKCHKPGALDSLYCLDCASKIILKRMYEERDKKKNLKRN
uniref:Uncharacterized protein n=1 Tax=viral metagenome TaxID=1070528 RepID=A0A6M3XZD6_9ZZZZ